MSDTSTLFAYTPPGCEYPEYLNIRETELIGGGQAVKITVRGPKRPPAGGRNYVVPGDTAAMTLPRDQLPGLINALLAVSPHRELDESKRVV